MPAGTIQGLTSLLALLMALALLEDLNRRGQTILLVTHDEHLARLTAHRIIRLTDGAIVDDQRTRLVA